MIRKTTCENLEIIVLNHETKLIWFIKHTWSFNCSGFKWLIYKMSGFVGGINKDDFCLIASLFYFYMERYISIYMDIYILV